MKSSFKKIMSLLLSISMLIGILSVPVIADENTEVQATESMYDGCVVADFSNLDYSIIDYSASIDSDLVMEGKIFKSSADAYGDGKSSLRINYYASQANGSIKLNTKGWRTWAAANPNAVLKIRYKTDNPGDIFNVQINNGYGVAPYHHQKITAKEGWNVFATTLADIVAKTDPSEENELAIKFDFTGWDVGVQNWTEEKGINIDKIWVENSDTVAPKANGSDDMIKSIPINLNHNGTWIYTNPREGGSSKVASYKQDGLPTSEKANFTYTVSEADFENYSLNDYHNINFWMYSPYPQAGGTYIAVTVKKVTAIDADGKYTYETATTIQKAVTFDWTGWKLINVPVGSAYTGTYTVTHAGTGEEVACEYYIQNIKNNNAWSSKIGVVRAETSQTPVVDLKPELGKKNGAKYIEGSNRVFHQDGSFDLESIYLSKNAPATEAAAPVVNSTPLKGLDTDAVVIDANSATFPAYTQEVVYDTTSPRLYAGTVKNSKLFGGATVKQGSGKWSISKGTSTNAGRVAPDTDTVATITNQKYFNMWMYSPSVMYDEFGNYSEYEIVIRNQNSATSSTNGRAIVIANWQGWKLISIPFDKIYNINKKGTTENPYEIRAVKITNNTWYNANESDLTKDITHYFTAQEITDGYRYTKVNDHNLFRTADNYFYIDRIWFSNEAPLKDFGAVTKPAGITKDADGNNEIVWTTQNPVGKIGIIGNEKAKLVIYNKSTGEYSSAEADVTFDANKVSVAADIPAGCSATVYIPEVFDAYGNKMDDIYQTATVSTDKFEYTVDSKGNAKITGYTENLSEAELENLVIPEKIDGVYPVTEVGGFSGNTTIKTLTLPSTLKTISQAAFSNCTSLVSVTMPSCETIGRDGFRGCAKLEYLNSDFAGEIVFPKNLKSLGTESFRIDNMVKTIILPDTITSMGNNVFYRASRVSEIYFPENLAEAVYKVNFVGGMDTYQPVKAIGKNTSYIKTFANAETSVDSVSGNKLYNYTEENSDIVVFSPEFVDGNGLEFRGTNKDLSNITEAIGFNGRLFNAGDDEIILKGIISVTSKDGLLKGIDTIDITVPGYEGITVSYDDFIIENITLENGDKAKVMFWEDLTSIKPVVTCDIEFTVDATTDEILLMTIGNSFASDSMFYLAEIAEADGVLISPYNCYYGGRPLNGHYERWIDETADYGLREVRSSDQTSKSISSKAMVSMYDWDYVILQGTTHATHYDTGLWGDDAEAMWQTFASDIADIVPNAKRLVNATWAPYEANAAITGNGMFADGTPDARGAYTTAALERYKIGANAYSTERNEDGSGKFFPVAIAVDYLIRHYGFPEHEGELSGDAYSNTAETRGVYRDTTCHLTNNVGRVLAGLVWYEMITGTPATENAYTRSTLSDADMTMIKEAAHYACTNYATYDPSLIAPAS